MKKEKVRTKFRNEISSLEPCDWCKRIIEITNDNYLLGATMFDDGVEDNCKCADHSTCDKVN